MNPNEPNDDIEARLAAMQPAEPSPALRHRIATSLDESPNEASADPRVVWPIQGRMLVGLAAAAAFALAGLVVVLVLLNPAEPQIADDSPPSPDTHQDPEPMHATPIEPTLFALNNALRESPEAVGDVLDRISTERFARTASVSRSTPPAVPVWGQPFTEDLQ